MRQHGPTAARPLAMVRREFQNGTEATGARSESAEGGEAGMEVDGMERSLGVSRLRRAGCSRVRFAPVRLRRTGCATLPPPDAKTFQDVV
jgi:hypothetical protein